MARCAFTARIERAQFHRARSASKKDAWLLRRSLPLSLLLLLSRGWFGFPLRATFSPAHPLADIFHPPYPPIASQSISRDVLVARSRAFQLAKPRFREWPRLPFTARIERAHSYRARSASKEGTWPLPPHLSEAARCASTEDHQPPSPPLFREQEDDQTTLSLSHLGQL